MGAANRKKAGALKKIKTGKKRTRRVSIQWEDYYGPVFKAAMLGDVVLLNEVLQEMNSSERTSALETKFRYGACQNETFKVTPLIVAAQNGNVDCVKVLLNYKADIEGREGDDDDGVDRKYSCKGCTPLFVAATHGRLDVLSCLVAHGADVDTRSIYNCTPLMIASRYGLEQVVTFLVEHGANMDLQDKNGETALHYAVDSGDVLSLSCLIRNGAHVNSCTNGNCTPLMKASLKGDMDAVTLLIEHGTNMDQLDKNGDTVLHYAVNGNSFEVVHKLSSLGASQLCKTVKD